jgi:hypothetical protein
MSEVRQGARAEPESRAALLARMRGPLAARDREVVEHWRSASPAAHARAMIELSRYAERIARQTGFRKRPDDMFPGFRRAAAKRPAGEDLRR